MKEKVQIKKVSEFFKKSLGNKFIVCGIFCVFFIVLLFILVNATTLTLYWIDSINPLTEIDVDWSGFWGGIIGGTISGIILVITVRMTIKNSKEELNISTTNSNMQLINTINQSEKSGKLSVRPLLTNVNVIEPDKKIQMVLRRFIKQNGFIYNNGFTETVKTLRELIDIDITLPYIFFSYRNIGLGPAVNIELKMKRVIKIEGLNDLEEVFGETVNDIYSRCECNDYENLIDWILYPSFSLYTNDEKVFGFFLKRSVDEMFFIIKINYEDILSNKYMQEHFFAFNNEEYIMTMYPISEQRSE